MTLNLTITDSLWQYEADKRNAAEDTRFAQAKAQYDAIISHTPELKRANIPQPTPAVHLTIEDLVKEMRDKEEARISASITSEHLATIAKQSPDTIQRFAKVTALPDNIKEMLTTQVDAL